MTTLEGIATHLKETVQQVKQQSGLPVFYPSKVPISDHSKLYIKMGVVEPGKSYVIDIDSEETCAIPQDCKIGHLRAELLADKDGKPTIEYNSNHKEVTVPVQLADGIRGYYTPQHTGTGSQVYYEQIQWREQGVLYTIVWDLGKQDAKHFLVDMANSAISSGPR
jgi:hypothetical protein